MSRIQNKIEVIKLSILKTVLCLDFWIFWPLSILFVYPRSKLKILGMRERKTVTGKRISGLVKEHLIQQHCLFFGWLSYLLKLSSSLSYVEFLITPNHHFFYFQFYLYRLYIYLAWPSFCKTKYKYLYKWLMKPIS